MLSGDVVDVGKAEKTALSLTKQSKMTGPLRAAPMPVRGRKRYRFHASVTFGFLGFCCLVQRAQSSMGQEEARLYDRNLQHFSPEGRIYQVQYAELAARRGNPVVAVSNNQDALALCVERRRASALEEPGIAWEKVGEIQQAAWREGHCVFHRRFTAPEHFCTRSTALRRVLRGWGC
ncbi:proteasome subunit alpha [Nannochloropsis gaditana]|uniref:Proteasome subunit alpha n=1 Tax=Nannochloropsis gaditana TaxID=72520 RepID=W7TRD0_9STRA|nr:proteasome subunit alpha [Nannochloropsis gaditana]